MTRRGGHRTPRLTTLALLVVGAMLAGALRAQAWPTRAATAFGLELGPSQLVAALHEVNRMEIAAGRMAQQNGATAAVRDYGRTLVVDHQAADDQLTSYVKGKGMSFDDVPLEFRNQQQALQAKLDKLQSVTGQSFDHAFALNMEQAHANVIAMIDASRPAVAKEGLVVLLDALKPILRKHHRMAENILHGTAGKAGRAR